MVAIVVVEALSRLEGVEEWWPRKGTRRVEWFRDKTASTVHPSNFLFLVQSRVIEGASRTC